MESKLMVFFLKHSIDISVTKLKNSVKVFNLNIFFNGSDRATIYNFCL